MDNVTEQIKERVNAVDLIGEYLKLEKAGSNYKALCPFHNEKTPSFMINPERNFWYCFGCQKGGDIFTFIQEMEGIEFREALEQLAEKAGVEIPRFQKENREEKNQKKRILEILNFSARFYQAQLQNNANGKSVREYLLNRKVAPEQLANFRIGYALDGWENLLNFLLSKNYRLADIIQTGLLVRKENQSADQKSSYYDRFRDRIMFPIIDINGNVIGFSARVRPGGDEKNAKYINTPQSSVYDKSQALYGLYQAKAEIKKDNSVIIVEGNMDVIASFSAGLQNTVAVSGTALADKQVGILKRYSDNFKFCFDMDQAGQQATKRSIQTCLEQDANIEVIILPEGLKDVNDLVIKNPALWKEAVKNAMPVMEYLFQSTFSKYSKDDPRGKRMIAYELLNIIKSIADPIEKNYWLKKLSDDLSVEEETLAVVLEKVRLKDKTFVSNEAVQAKEQNEETIKPKSRLCVLQEKLLGLFSLFPTELKKELEQVKEHIFEGKYEEIKNSLKEGRKKEFSKELSQCEVVTKYSYDKEEGFLENEIDPFQECQLLLEEISRERARESLKKIAWDIKRAEREKDNEALEILMKEFTKMSRQFDKEENSDAD